MDLTINPSSSTYTTQTACDIYTFNGNTYTLSGTYSQSFVNALGCDSIHTLDLTINSVINSITQAGATLSANAVGATYQWITCKDSLNIPGATNQIYTAIANGNYAVIVTQNGCIDTSVCHTVTGVSLNDYLEANSIQISPNPTKDIIYITSKVPFKNVSIKIVNVMGEVIIEKEHLSGNHFEFYISNEANGVYFIEIKTSEGIKSAKLLKE